MKIKFHLIDVDGTTYHEGETKTMGALKSVFSDNAEIQKIKISDVKSKTVLVKRPNGTAVMIFV